MTPRERLSAGSLLLATLLALVGLSATVYGLRHTHGGRAALRGLGFEAGAADDADDDNSDPSSVETIYLGGPDEAPVATRPGAKARTVHPFVVVQLPRGDGGSGQIPDSAAGRLLYQWMAAFNSRDLAVAARALAVQGSDATEAAQLELRRETGGFTLLSAKEVEPGLLVFRMHDQTPAENEVLGTLQMRAGAGQAGIASFSLRQIAASAVKR